MTEEEGWSDPSYGDLEVREANYDEKVCERCKQIYSRYNRHSIEDCISSLEERFRKLWEHVTKGKA
jgi:hypothetical protein